MIDWFTQTELGKLLSTFFISMVPVVELRGGLPVGLALGLDYYKALAAAIAGNLLPVPFVIVFIRKIFAFLRKKSKWMDKVVTALETKGHLKGKTVVKYGPLGLCLFVAIPLPGTGAWTGALIAAMLDIRLKRAVPWITLGVLIAAGIISLISFGVISAIS